MSLGDLVAGTASIARGILGPDSGVTVQVQLLLGSNHAYNPATDTMTDTGTLVTVPALRWQEKLQVSTGLRSRGHRLDGLIATGEKLMFFASDLGSNNIKQDDNVLLLADDGMTWQRWQLKEVDPIPTRAIFICTIERS